MIQKLLKHFVMPLRMVNSCVFIVLCMKKKCFCLLGLIVALFNVGCQGMKESVAKQQAQKKAKKMGLNLAKLKEGEACKYVGFIGDDSVTKAKQNGNIKFLLFNYSDGNLLKKCTYAYGK